VVDAVDSAVDVVDVEAAVIEVAAEVVLAEVPVEDAAVFLSAVWVPEVVEVAPKEEPRLSSSHIVIKVYSLLVARKICSSRRISFQESLFTARSA